jgi:phage gp16-like protein
MPHERRARLIAQAHMAARQAGLNDEERRAVQHGVTGLASCQEMSVRQLVMLLDHYARLGVGVRASAPEAPGEFGVGPTRWQLATIERLAWDQGWEGGLEDPALIRFVRRTAKVGHPRWLTRRMASAVITGLRRWHGQRARR